MGFSDVQIKPTNSFLIFFLNLKKNCAMIFFYTSCNNNIFYLSYFLSSTINFEWYIFWFLVALEKRLWLIKMFFFFSVLKINDE